MAEYIDREALLEDIDAAVKNSGMGYVIGKTLKRYVKLQTAADVAPVRHGRWAIDEFGHYCTVCREYGPETEGDAEIVDLLKYGTPYCPNCGAKMDGGMNNGH